MIVEYQCEKRDNARIDVISPLQVQLAKASTALARIDAVAAARSLVIAGARKFASALAS